MSSNLFYESITDFAWQYEHSKRWRNFSDEEMQHLNDAVKKGQHSTTLCLKKQGKQVLLDFNKMLRIHSATLYEQRIRCLVSNAGFYVWLWKNDKDEWVSYSPELTFLLEVAYQKKETKICLPDYELDLENFEQINKETQSSLPISREHAAMTPTEGLQAIIQKNESIFTKTCSGEFSSVKRSFDALSTISNGTGARKKYKASSPSNDVEDETILPVDGILRIKDNLGVMKATENGRSLSDVSVDAECPVKRDFHIYFQNTAFSATLNLTSLQNNNNKFYIIQLLEHNSSEQYCVWRRWGRVGQRGQTNLNKYGTSLSEAIKEFEKKFYDKTRNDWEDFQKFVHVKGKYDLVHVNLVPQVVTKALDVESRLASELKALMQLICDTQRMEEIMKEMSYDSNKTPLGELTLSQVKSGYIALNKIAMVLKLGGSHSELLNACSDFYTKIPHNFGMKTPPIIKTQADIEKKQAMLEALSNIRVAINVMNSETDENVQHPLDKYYKTLNCSLDLLEPDCSEYMAIEKCLQETHGPTHSTYKMEIINIFKCFKLQEETSFIDHGNKLILFHGSRIINWLGILKDGLRIAPPEAPRSGYMFGKGIYFADVSSKSANYCYATKKKNEGLLLMCEVSVGKQFPLLEADDELPETLPSDCNSVFGKGRVSPTDFQIAALSSEAKVPVGPLKESQEHEGTLHYNEYIVYRTKQVKMKYLIRIKFNFK